MKKWSKRGPLGTVTSRDRTVPPLKIPRNLTSGGLCCNDDCLPGQLHLPFTLGGLDEQETLHAHETPTGQQKT